jgi:hypothetical protein
MTSASNTSRVSRHRGSTNTVADCAATRQFKGSLKSETPWRKLSGAEEIGSKTSLLDQTSPRHVQRVAKNLLALKGIGY